MFKEYLRGIDGIATYPLFSLVVSFFFFVAITVWVIKVDGRRLKEISELPLDDHQDPTIN